MQQNTLETKVVNLESVCPYSGFYDIRTASKGCGFSYYSYVIWCCSIRVPLLFASALSPIVDPPIACGRIERVSCLLLSRVAEDDVPTAADKESQATRPRQKMVTVSLDRSPCQITARNPKPAVENFQAQTQNISPRGQIRDLGGLKALCSHSNTIQYRKLA